MLRGLRATVHNALQILTCTHAPGNLVKTQALSHALILGGNLRCCRINEIPGDINGTSPQTPA